MPEKLTHLTSVEIMDSKNIFISYEHYTRNIDWEKSGENEWIYVGADEDFDVEKVINL